MQQEINAHRNSISASDLTLIFDQFRLPVDSICPMSSAWRMKSLLKLIRPMVAALSLGLVITLGRGHRGQAGNSRSFARSKGAA